MRQAARRPKQLRVQVGQFAYGKTGVAPFDWTDPYHVAVTLTWPRFISFLLGSYLLVNTLFGVLYMLVPGCVTNARPGSISDAFFFSLETLATVGYGEMYPASLYGHLVASAEVITGLGFTAIMTGLVFVRFSRPRAKFLVADKLVVCQHNGVPTLMGRIGNGRIAALSDAHARLNVLLAETSAEGAVFRRIQELRLLRARLPLFPLTWTLMHVMDASSPLHGMDGAAMIAAQANMFLTIEARDPTLATTVHETKTYGPQDVLFGMRYVDAISTDPDGTPIADMARVGMMEPDTGAEARQSGWSEREPEED